MSNVVNRLAQEGYELPGQRRKGKGVRAFVIQDDLLFINGVSPLGEDGAPACTGRLGKDLTLEQGYEAARLVGIRMLSVIKDALGDLDRVEHFVRCVCLVNNDGKFGKINEVADGFSDLLTEAFGARGLSARSVLGASGLNNNVPVVCDAIIKFRT